MGERERKELNRGRGRGPNLCQRFSMRALCKYAPQQVERTCHTDRFSIVSSRVMRVVVVVVVVAVVFSLRSIKIMLIKCHFIDGT